MHKLSLNDCASMHVEGVISVNKYNDREIVLSLEDKRLSIGGEGLSLTRIDTVGKIADIEGNFTSIRYLSSGVNVLKRIFK